MFSNNNIGDKFQEVKHRLNIKDVAIKLNSNLSQQGRDTYHGTCPIGHNSVSKKSFHVNTNQQLCYCFNCGVGGDAISLVEKVKGLSKWESLKWLNDTFQLNINLGNVQNNNQPTPEEEKERKERIKRSILFEKIFEIGKEKLYQDEGKEALEYLTKTRRYDPDVLKETEWFYLPKSYEIKKELLDKYPEMKNDIGNLKLQGYFGDNFRLAFPYRNIDGEITGFLKRAIEPQGISVTSFDGKTHKNVRWDSTPGLKKDDLFGLDKITKDEDTLLIVEGYPDAIYLRAAGIENITAVGQGKLSKKHLQGLRKRKIKNVVISFDNDGVGADNTKDAVMMVLEETNIIPYVIDPKEYGTQKDPDEYFKAFGVTKLQFILSEKIVLGAEWMIERILEEYDKLNTIEKKRKEEEIFTILHQIRDESMIADLYNPLKNIFNNISLAAFKRLIKSKREINKDKIVESVVSNPIVPFIDITSNSRCYYRKYDDTLSIGIDEKILENILIDHGIKVPGIYPTFKVVFNPKDMGEKFDLYGKTFNLFTPTSYMFMKKDNQKIDLEVSCPRTFELLKNLIPIKNERKHFVNWLSYTFNTREKARTAWVFKGVQGSGKNLFFDNIIKPLFGENQTIVVDDDRLQSDFNGYMNNKLFVAFNEVANDETRTKRSVKSKIKALITDSKIIVNEKHVRTYEIDNFANILFFSNEAIPLLIEEQDRRFNVIETGGKLKDVASFKKDPNKFIADLENELPKFTQYLLNYNYDSVSVDEVLENQTKEDIKELSMNKYELFAKKLKLADYEWFEQFYPEPKSSNDVKDNLRLYITKQELIDKKIEQSKMLDTFYWVNGRELCNQGKLTKMMKIYDIKKHRERRTYTSTYYYVW